MTIPLITEVVDDFDVNKVPNRGAPDDFEENMGLSLTYQAVLPVSLNAMTSEINTTVGAINSAVGEVSDDAQTATEQATIATTKSGEAGDSADLAENWASKTDGVVGSVDYSSKEYAIGDNTPLGSSKRWASEDEDVIVSGSEYSAKHYAAKAAESVSTLPEGTLNDALTTTENAWSASKIDTEKADKNEPQFTGEVSFGGEVGNSGEFLQSQGVGGSPVWAALSQVRDYQEFTTSGTWNKPDDASFVYVEEWAGGGGGGNDTGSAGAAGGSGGGYISAILDASTLASSEPVIVGAGGSGGVVDEDGSDGGDSSFAGIIAPRGYGGRQGNSSYVTPSAGAPHITASSSSLTPQYLVSSVSGAGNSAGSGAAGGYSTNGGGGGGGGSSSPSAVGGSSARAGDGGAGNATSGLKAEDGQYPSGGGGGSTLGGGGGDGADGIVKIWTW